MRTSPAGVLIPSLPLMMLCRVETVFGLRCNARAQLAGDSPPAGSNRQQRRGGRLVSHRSDGQRCSLRRGVVGGPRSPTEAAAMYIPGRTLFELRGRRHRPEEGFDRPVHSPSPRLSWASTCAKSCANAVTVTRDRHVAGEGAIACRQPRASAARALRACAAVRKSES
jgi:hypothetical protein